MTDFRWSESEVFKRLSVGGVFPPGPFVLIPQVRNGTGYTKRTRTADAVAVSVWPSRGLYIAGVEIKVSRADWLKERKDPGKSVSIQRFCKYWYVAAPDGIVPAAEVPETWGLIECHGKAGAVITKAAPKLEAESPDISFLASVLRSAIGCMTPTDQIEGKIREAREAGEVAGKQFSRSRASELEAVIEGFENASGLKIGDRSWVAREVGEAVKFCRENKLPGVKASVARMVRELEVSLERLKPIAAELGIGDKGQRDGER